MTSDMKFRLIIFVLNALGTGLLAFAFTPQSEEEQQLQGFKGWQLVRYNKCRFWVGLGSLFFSNAIATFAL